MSGEAGDVQSELKGELQFRPGAPTTPEAAAKHTLRILARRYQQLDLEIEGLDRHLDELVRRHAPELLAHKGVGIEVAATLLTVAGDNPNRLNSEAAFAALCGVAPLQPPAATSSDTGSAGPETAKPTTPSGGSCSFASTPTNPRRTT
jgi:transposase